MKEGTGNKQPVERNGRFTFDSSARTGSEFQGPYDAHPHQHSSLFTGVAAWHSVAHQRCPFRGQPLASLGVIGLAWDCY